MLTRRSHLVSALALASLAPRLSWGAERWPARPIVLTVIGAPGSPPDAVARDLAERIGLSLGQPIVIENAGGGGGIVGMEQMRRASPDGHRFVFTHIGAVAINPALFKSLPYDPVRDFEAVSLVLTGPMVLVAAPSLGVESLAQLLELARRHPGTLMYGSAGIGGPSHVFTEQFKAATQLSIDHVPFKGAPGLAHALRGGHIAVGMEGAAVMLPLIAAGTVRALAVTGEARLDALPQVPTFAETGVPDIGVSWMAVMAPKGTLPEAVSRLNAELTRVLAAPDLRRAYEAIGRRVAGGPPEVLAARIRSELPRWKAIIERAGILPE